MSVATPTISPLRQRMIEDMRMRKLSDNTQTHYIRASVVVTGSDRAPAQLADHVVRKGAANASPAPSAK